MAVEKREQVFVSSTFLDLQEERQAVIQTLLQADCFPAGMELFPASDDEKWDLIKRVIDDSDYYVVVIGGRYGSVDEDGLSFTEKEFDYAVETKTPVMAFLHGAPGNIPVDKAEVTPRARELLDAFRDKASQRMVKFWTTPADLAGAVALSLIQTRKTHPAEGWVRASQALTPEVEKDMAELRATVATLTAQLEAEKSGGATVRDTSIYAQGDDLNDLFCTIRYWTKEDAEAGRTTRSNSKAHYFHLEISWDEIFSHLAPLMLDEASEEALSEELDVLAAVVGREQVNLPPDAGKAGGIEAGLDEFNDVKVQFFALGLIDHSARRHPVQDKQTYWTLTPKGRDHMTRLRAKKRPEPAQQVMDLP
ncbi:DUF4062 domain-containing protein [Blastococcus sp. VKM Ac-2987]|uniref:DUF4062 domain-containing protein n=1 Tax=Blastococcus sp. VKM Ac-2987 TaxID=3004141 RepID=UPI0022AB79AD|nr:DUF4062 domain-containing protein [Blastococcus sp. VKM Ac-2987]MCZ2857834.1 DUF4062 domain-containing protein [Blastococcus sp. VKM Ac-2987]